MKKLKSITFVASSACKNVDLDVDCQAGDEVEIEEGYALPRSNMNGSRRPAVVEQLCPQLRPKDKDWERDVFSQAPKAAPAGGPGKSQLPTVAGLMKAGVARGVAEAIVAAAQGSVTSQNMEGVETFEEEEPAPAPKSFAKAAPAPAPAAKRGRPPKAKPEAPAPAPSDEPKTGEA